MPEVNETTVLLKIEANMSTLKSTLQNIKSTIQSALKTSIDLTFNVRGEKQIEAMKQRIAKEIKIPVSFKNDLKAPIPQNNTSKPENFPVPQIPQSGFKGMLSQLKDVQSQISAGISGAVLVGFSKGMANSIREVGSKVENMKVMLNNALGGVAEGTAAMEMIKETANEIRLPIEEVGSGFNKLINRGLKPTKQEFINLTDVAKSQGKEVDQYIEAVLDAMTGENERLKEFGIKAKDAGDKVILTFKGVSTEVKKNEQDIYNYLVALGKVPGVAGMSAKSADTFSGKLAVIQSKIDGIKIVIFERIGEALKPVLDVITNVLDGFKKWAEKNPELASGLTIIIMAITGLVGAFLTLTPIIMNLLPALGTALGLLTGPIGWVVLAVIALIAIFWDLWNGLTTGESYIFAIIDGFLEWIGVGLTLQEIIDGLRVAFDVFMVYITDFLIPTIVAQFQFLIDSIVAIWEFLTDWISIWIEIIIALFTGNIPRAAEGFERLKDAVLNIFDRIVAAAAEAVSKILAKFSDGVAKIGDMLKDVPFLGGLVKGGTDKLSKDLKNKSNKAKEFSDKKKKSVNERKERISDYSGKGKTGENRFKMPGGNKKKDKSDPYGKMKGSLGGTSSSPNKKGKSKNKGGSKGKNDKTEDNRIIVTAIEGLQDILKKTGYDITSEIKRANLFESKRKAVLDSQRKEGVFELFKNIKDRIMGNTKEVNYNNKLEIFLNGSNGSLRGISGNTKLSDLFKIQNSRSGG